MSFSSQSSNELSQVPLFQDLDPAVLQRLADQSWVRTYPDGQVLTSEGDPGESLLVLEAGEAKISRFTPSGQEVVLAIVEAPTSIGELALIDGAPRSATVTAQSQVIVRVVPRQAFQQLLDETPQTMRAVLRALSAMVRSTNERLSDILALDVPGRVAKWLLVRAAERGVKRAGTIVVPFEISQRELAAELGTTRVSINKALKTFESLNAIKLLGDEIELINTDLLIEYTY